MKRRFRVRTLWGRIAGVFIMLSLLTAFSYTALFLRSWLNFTSFSEQILNWTLADDLRIALKPYTEKSLDIDNLHRTLYKIKSLNPKIEVYLLDENGNVLVSLVPTASTKQVNVKPIKEFLNLGRQPERPLYGDDPELGSVGNDTGREVVFSAARITIEGKPAYVYVVLGGRTYKIVAAMLGERSLAVDSIILACCIFLFSLLLGLWLFSLITKRFYRMTETVQRFKEGDLSQRIDTGPIDEVGLHAVAFNQMADTIVANIGQLEKTDELRRELIANVSHDLRKPIALMQLMLESINLRLGKFTQEEQHEHLERAINACKRLNNIVSDLFELSKLNTGALQPKLDKFSIEGMVNEIVNRFMPLSRVVSVTLEKRVSEKLDKVLADRNMIERVLANLIDNALRYTPEDGKVEVSVIQHSEKIKIEVSDTGIGINENDLPYIFDRFYRTETGQSKDSSGTGLGLAIAFKMVELHGSQLLVSSKVNQGTSFSFELNTVANL